MGCCSVENQIFSALPVDLNMLSFGHEKLVMWVGVHLFQVLFTEKIVIFHTSQTLESVFQMHF